MPRQISAGALAKSVARRASPLIACPAVSSAWRWSFASTLRRFQRAVRLVCQVIVPLKRPPTTARKARRLMSDERLPPEGSLAQLAKRAKYCGSAKHKEHPHLFGLGSSGSASAGDATLCDRDSGFRPEDRNYVGSWMSRGIKAGLVSEFWEEGAPKMIWALSDDGWIYEARITNQAVPEYHGWPLLAGDPFVALVYDRFRRWVDRHPKSRNESALKRCGLRYGCSS